MDAATPLVSIIMSVYNGEQWLDEAIDSIVQQTYTNWEFIIIDDASAKPAQDILHKYRADPRFHIERNETQKGLTKNLNTAIARCRGSFIARMDADDKSLPRRLEKQAAYLQQHPAVAVVAGFVEWIDATGTPCGTWTDDRRANNAAAIRQLLPERNCIAHPSVMIRANVLRQYRYNEVHTHSQDWDLWLRLCADDKLIEKINEPLLLYRVHTGSVTSLSVKKSAFAKKNEFYRRYLAGISGNHMNAFNRRVRRRSRFNRIKLFLSRIKRKFIL